MKDLICKNILKVETIDNTQTYTFAPPDGCRGILFSFDENIASVRFFQQFYSSSAPALDPKNQYTWYQELYPNRGNDVLNDDWVIDGSSNFTNLTVLYLG
jgi:hypothetical protein